MKSIYRRPNCNNELPLSNKNLDRLKYLDKNSWVFLFLKQYWIFWSILILIILRIFPFYYFIIFYIVFCVYHRLISSTEIIFTKNSIMDEIIKKSNLNNFKFKPSFFFPITPLQFINLDRTKKNPKNRISVTRKYVGNNGVCLDWIKYEGIDNEKNPILIIFPGLTGCIDDPYVINIANEAIIKGGFNTCIYQMRVLTDKLKIEKRYFFLLDDIDEALDEIRKEYGENKIIYGVGFSYGANQLVKYLGKFNHIKKKINAGVSISNPYELIISTRLCANKVYDRILLTFLQRVAVKSEKNLKNLNIDFNYILNVNQLKEFDKYYTSFLLGFKSSDDYYRGISSVYEMENINVPLLCISSKDDQVCFEESIPYDDIKLNKNIALIVTSHGTHNCFIENDGLLGVKQWAPQPAISFLKAIQG